MLGKEVTSKIEYKIYNEGDFVEFKLVGNINGRGYIRGESILGEWIIEIVDIQGCERYPYSCISVDRDNLSLIKNV